jgi:hypothetical protein
MTKSFEIVEIRVEEGVDVGSKFKQKKSYFPIQCYRGEFFYHSMLADNINIVSKFYIGHLLGGCTVLNLYGST